MPRYRYIGTDFAGRQVTGERDAADPDALLAALSGEAAQVASVQLVGSDAHAEPVPKMHRNDVREVSGHISEIIESQLPLESGLAAVAAECPSPRLRRLLWRIAFDLAAGNSLESVFSNRAAPSELRALVRAGARSGNTGQILEHYVVNVESAVDLKQSMWRGLLYPLVLLIFFGLVGTATMTLIVPQFIGIFAGFDLQVPLPTKWLAELSTFVKRYGVAFSMGGLAAIVAGAILVRLALGRVAWRRLICRVPPFGPILRWTALARFSQLLALLVENQVPLDEALALAGDASGDAEIQHDCRRMVASVTAGETLESAARRLDRFPTSFVQALGWASRPAGLPEVLQSLGDMYAGRVRAAVAIIVAVLPPLLMIFLGLSTAFLIVALFLPLLELLHQLS